MTTSPLVSPPIPSKDRSGLTSYAQHLLARITREGLGADVHHWVETPTRTTSAEACPWCSDGPFAISILAHSDHGTDECCYYCVPAVMDSLADQGQHPETVTLDVYLSPETAHGWSAVTA